jgi:hypothetical protein
MPSTIRIFDPGDSMLLSTTKLDALYELSNHISEAQYQNNVANPANLLALVVETQTNDSVTGRNTYGAAFTLPTREVLNTAGDDTELKPRSQLSEYLPWNVTTGDLAGTTSAEEALIKLAKQINFHERRIPATNVFQTPNTITYNPEPENGQLILGVSIGLDRSFEAGTGRPQHKPVDHIAVLDYILDQAVVP